MGTFGIFAIVATIILLGYYVVIITLDCHKESRKEKKEDVEIIHTTEQEAPEALEEEKPVDVDEDSFMHGTNTLDEQSPSQESDSHSEDTFAQASVEEINNLKASELHEKIEKAKEEMITYKADAEKEYSIEDFQIGHQQFDETSSEVLGSLSQINEG